jgi:ComF family protein
LSIAHFLLNLFLQSNCPLCDRSDRNQICQYCVRQLQKCHLKDPDLLWQKPFPLFAWGMYGGALKRAIAVMKYENQPQIACLLGEWLGEAWLNSSKITNHQLVVVPVPLHPSKQKERGYNQAALIAQGFCDVTGFKLKQNALKRVRDTIAQFGLSASEREQNLVDAFAIGQEFHSRPNVPVLLIDDIYTTGATGKACVKTLLNHGVSVDGLAAVATVIKNK